jgi:DNA mismatch repair protein MutS2
MDDKSLKMLEFPYIRELLAGFTSFSTSHELAINLQPYSNSEKVSLLLRQSAEARHLLSMEPELSIGDVVDIREEVKLARRGKILEPKTLLKIQQTLTSIHLLRKSLEESTEETPLLWKLASGLFELYQLEKTLSNCIKEPGELLSTASPQLTLVRQKIKQVREQLINQLQSIINSAKGNRIIQEPIIDQREDRYVILVKAEYRKEIKGIIHDTSNSGATVFIEPWSVMEQGNDLRELIAEERREIERILRDLSTRVGEYESEISNNIAITAELDLALAKARYARKAKATEPTINIPGQCREGDKSSETPLLKLIEARHPLLGENAVPLTVEIGNDYSILVITGPNTGGKTVTLKTIGLLSVMAQAGMPIPASSHSCLPMFDSIFADIGDEQSIEQTLSTFSWHMDNIIRIIRDATKNSLVLLDELGTSTDPVEGSALACSILRYFLKQETMTVATTHYSDLKIFAYTNSGLRNASLDFDSTTLMPTYHLTIGIPGGSNALATAYRLGLPPEIVTGAREMLPAGAMELEALLSDLMTEKQRVEGTRLDLENEKAVLEGQMKEWKDKLRSLKIAERDIVQETRDKVVRAAADLEKEIRQSLAALRKEQSRQGIQKARKTIDAIEEKLSKAVWQIPEIEETDRAKEERNTLVEGDMVQIRGTNAVAKVVSTSDKSNQLQVQIGQTSLWLDRDSLEKVPSLQVDEGNKSAVTVKKDLLNRPISLELDLRGKRAEEIEWALEGYLSDASMANLKQVSIIHGYGTGTVRSITREFLSSYPLVKSFRPGELNEGGDGVTIVNL